MKDGGPAFPQNDLSSYGMGPSEIGNGGMTLRDWFAGRALNAIITDTLSPQYCEFGDGTSPSDRIAERCYAIADAMIAARKETGHE